MGVVCSIVGKILLAMYGSHPGISSFVCCLEVVSWRVSYWRFHCIVNIDLLRSYGLMLVSRQFMLLIFSLV